MKKNKTLKLLVTRGIPASGKTTFAKELVRQSGGTWKRVNKDDLRAMIDHKFSKQKEKFIKMTRDRIICDALTCGYNVVCDDTNLRKDDIAHFEELILPHQTIYNYTSKHPDADWHKNIDNVELEIKWFPITIDQALSRDARRENSVGEKVICHMYNNYLKAGGPLPVISNGTYHQPKNKPECIVVDLDGTLALFKNKRSPYEQEFCNEDDLNGPVAQLVYSMGYNYPIVLCSGRSDKYRPQTEEFLQKNGVLYDYLFMREEGDTRKDVVVKREIYFREIAPRYRVLFCLDDRDCIVEMWRQLGIDCFQVNWGNF